MTKIVKFWMKFSFWDKVRGILTALGISGEVALYLGDSHPNWKVWFAVATVISIILTYLIKDDNKNNIIDILE